MFVNSCNTLNEYFIHSKIGEGNLSTIYEAIHKQDGVKRAIKVMDFGKFCSFDSEFYAEVEKQIALLNRISDGEHTNIVHYYRISHFEHQVIIEMQYVNGINLNDFINKNKHFVEIREVINLLTDIASALKFLHYDICYLCNNEINQSIVYSSIKANEFVLHNDIHTLNILREVSGKYILIDLDFAIEGNPTDYEKQNFIDLRGMSWFKAPEKWRKVGNISTQSDIYSFGMVIYWFLTGEPPFLSNNYDVPYEKILESLDDVPVSIFNLRKRNFERNFPNKTYVKDYPIWLVELVVKCLKIDPNERFKDGNELYQFIMSHKV